MKSEEKQLAMDYKNTFGPEAGKRVLKNLMKLSNFNYSIVPRDNNGKIDIHEVMRREGQRSVIINIIKQLEKKL